MWWNLFYITIKCTHLDTQMAVKGGKWVCNSLQNQKGIGRFVASPSKPSFSSDNGDL